VGWNGELVSEQGGEVGLEGGFGMEIVWVEIKEQRCQKQIRCKLRRLFLRRRRWWGPMVVKIFLRGGLRDGTIKKGPSTFFSNRCRMKFFAVSCEVFGVLELNSLVTGRAGAADIPAWDRLRGIEGTGSTTNNTKTPRVLMIDA
jgi:hypothetical protein